MQVCIVNTERNHKKRYQIMVNNGTTDCTDCPEEYECECEIYDDIFLGLKEN